MRKINTGLGYEIELPTDYEDLKVKAEKEIDEILADHPKARKLWNLMKNDPEVNANWDMADFITTGILHYNDHGEVHAKIVAANALKMLKILVENSEDVSFLTIKGVDLDDLFLIVLAGSLLHDIGNQVHREKHNLHGVYLAIPILNRMLPQIYTKPEIMYEIRGHILHTIYAHEYEVDDLTLAAGLVGVADGTDMTKGRGRLAYDLGNVNIHSVSALSVENVEISKGERRPIRITIKFSNSAGIFQIEAHLTKKVSHSPLKDYVEIVAEAYPTGQTDYRIVHRIIVEEGKLKAY